MIECSLCDEHGILWIRVSKAKARKLFESGETVVMCPAKLYPFGYCRYGIHVSLPPDVDTELHSFDAVLNNFLYYNCTCNETGLYASFYARLEETE